MAKYRKDRIELSLLDESLKVWTFGGKTVKGRTYRYAVKDGNFRTRSQWEFIVRVPSNAYGRIEVRPVVSPNLKAYAGLDRRSLTFMRGTLGPHTKSRYCPLALALPEGSGTKDLVHRTQKGLLPAWMRQMIKGHVKQKATVRNTHGFDGASLVVLVNPNDHAAMIALFLATKAWVRKSGFVLD